MDKLASALEGETKGWEGLGYVRIDGSNDAIERRTAANRFRDDLTISVALLSITAAGQTSYPYGPRLRLGQQSCFVAMLRGTWHFVQDTETRHNSLQYEDSILSSPLSFYSR